MSPGLLVTGFGSFPGMPANPSGRLARRVAALGRLRLGHPRALVLRTAYDAIPSMLEPALAEAPAAVLMIGVSARATRVRVEIRARNRASRLFPDASGRIAAGLSLDADGPAARRSPVAGKALASLRRNGVPACLSQDAGRYLCNAAYFRALREDCPVVFLHIPVEPRSQRRSTFARSRRRRPAEALAEAVLDVARVLLVAARVRRGLECTSKTAPRNSRPHGSQR